MAEQWIDAVQLDELPPGSAKVVRRGRVQVALFHLEDGSLYAIDNRCPHEGYPMAEGYVKDCVVTCAWHNYKFRLSDGECIMGEEAIRTYPTRLNGEWVAVDITQPDPKAAIPGLLESLETAMQHFRMGQAARDVARLLEAGYDPRRIAFFAALYDAQYAEWGASHALAIAYDVIQYLEDYPGIEATLPLMQALEMSARANQLRPKRILPKSLDLKGNAEEVGITLCHWVEDEKAEEAQALLLGALQKGWRRSEIEPWFFELCAQHFLNFGHALIYQQKVFDLLDLADWEGADWILSTFLYGIVNGTRHDTLPKWRGFQKLMAQIHPTLPEAYGRMEAHTRDPQRVERILAVLLDGSRRDLEEAFTTDLEAGLPLLDWVDGISLGAAERMLRFDQRIELDIRIQNNWLDVTHLLTFANALRTAAARFQSPHLLKLVLQGARFVHGAKALDEADAERMHLVAAEGAPADLLSALEGALLAQNSQEAVQLVAGILKDEGSVEALARFYQALSLDDKVTRPIVVTHVIKTYLAALEEYRALEGHPRRAYPLLALTRLLASPLRERRIGQVVHEAIQFVKHGKTPKDLT